MTKFWVKNLCFTLICKIFIESRALLHEELKIVAMSNFAYSELRMCTSYVLRRVDNAYHFRSQGLDILTYIFAIRVLILLVPI